MYIDLFSHLNIVTQIYKYSFYIFSINTIKNANLLKKIMKKIEIFS